MGHCIVESVMSFFYSLLINHLFIFTVPILGGYETRRDRRMTQNMKSEESKCPELKEF